MAGLPQIRGALLEEAILHSLRWAGFRVVSYDPTDETLTGTPDFLKVKGRGARHQIDALAEFEVSVPFVNRQRLIIEAKCRVEKTQLHDIRNAVGVYKDVNEYWTTHAPGVIPRSRFHYFYAFFSASEFTRDAQEYAFAQDVYLFPLGDSAYFRPILDALDALGPVNLGHAEAAKNLRIDLGGLRRDVRRALQSNELEMENGYDLQVYLGACARAGLALLGVANGAFPVFLTPVHERVMTRLRAGVISVEIGLDDGQFFIRHGNEKWFSFDLPSTVFQKYAESGSLSREAALRLKQEQLHEIQAVVHRTESFELVRFRLDQDWITRVREGLGAE